METDEQISMLSKRVEQTKNMIVQNIEIVYGHEINEIKKIDN